MTTVTIPTSLRVAREGRLGRLWATNPPLVALGLASIVLLAVTAALALADPRVITGAQAWVKPMKFAISTVFYTFSLVWLLSFIQGHRRLVAVIGWASTIALVVELVLIVLQVARGVASHFNYSTPFDAAVFSAMAGFIGLAWTMSLIAIVLLVRQRMSDGAFGWSLRLGLIAAALGMGLAFLMTAPNASQIAALQAGAGNGILGAHAVGVPDGGPGLPLLGWSTEGGDLRIAHFFGLHGLQVLPLLGLVISRLVTARLNLLRRTLLVVTAGLGYLALVLGLAWQALRGQSIIHPDGLTLAALAALIGAVALAAGLIIVTARSSEARHA
jgi:hypothetical protein